MCWSEAHLITLNHLGGFQHSGGNWGARLWVMQLKKGCWSHVGKVRT